MTARSLEDFLKQKRALTNAASPKTFSEYMHSNGIQPIKSYTDAVKSAIGEKVTRGGGYGSLAEGIGRSGLSKSGYREYLESTAKEREITKTLEAKKSMEDEYLLAQGGFEKYLQKYRASNDGKMQSLEAQLVEFGIMRLDETYAIGIDYGLSPEDAATVSATVYRTLRDETFDKCLSAAQAAYISEKEMKSYAERMGLLPEDVERLLWEAGRYLNRGNISAESLDAIIKKSDE